MKKATRPEFSNGDAGLMTMRALDDWMRNVQESAPHQAGRTSRQVLNNL